MKILRKYEKELHNVWKRMRERCNDVNNKDYGGRGIKVCHAWKKFDKFYDYAITLYVPGLTIDRINNDGDYKPGNIRWTTRSIQNSNQRRSWKYRKLNEFEDNTKRLALSLLKKIIDA